MNRVAVIGAGPSGLAALRHLALKPEKYRPVAFEQSSVVGGQWVYTDEVGYHKNGLRVHTSMYKNLKTNLPKEMFTFSGFSFPDHLPSYMHHEDVRKYLEDFTDQYQLKDFIRFNNTVKRIRPLQTTEWKCQWEIQIKNIEDQTETSEVFDAVLVCSGVCSFPFIPEIEGMSQFRGVVIHSHDYRTPEMFKDMHVVILGGDSSAQDISLDVAQSAKEVIISHYKERLQISFPSNVRQTLDIDRMTYNSAVMKDGEQCRADALILCTGYKKSFPFVSPECQVTTEDKRIFPLYKHIINVEHPSLAFIGMQEITNGFYHFECQVKFFLSTLEGTYTLPSKEAMMADIKRDSDWRISMGFPPHRPHLLAQLERIYDNELARLGKFTPNEKNFYDAFELIVGFYFSGFAEYTTINLPMTASGSIDIEKLATFPEYARQIRNGTIDKNTKF